MDSHESSPPPQTGGTTSTKKTAIYHTEGWQQKTLGKNTFQAVQLQL